MSLIGIIIQARMGSARLPGKVLRSIVDRPLLEYVLKRLDKLQHDVCVVVATSTELQDDVIADYCLAGGYNCFRGSEMDVLARYYHCATNYKFEQIIRLTADNPFTDIEELDHLIYLHLSEHNDYTHSFGELPLGVGAEVFTFNALERSYREGNTLNHREHVNEYVQENPDQFKISQLRVAKSKTKPELRLTVDTEEDFERACYIVEQVVTSDWVSTEEAIELCSRCA